jgi:NAD(P)H-nitrite reductase large subunit
LHYVIIGNGGAGISGLQAIREVDKESKVTIISREQYPAYSPCSLPSLLGGEIEKPTIFRFDKQFYSRLNANFIKNMEALEINTKNKKVRLADNKNVKFDKLLIATGAKPIIPKKMKGLKLEGVHIMGTLDATLRILNQLKQGVDHAVVVGGGFMGIETAVMLSKRGIDVSVVEMLPNILSRMLDPDMSQKVTSILEEHDIKLILNDSVKNINGAKRVTSVALSNKTLTCDMVVISIGVTPNTDVIKGSGIKVNQGILVDSTMQTNLRDIYAAGDIAEVREQIENKQGSFAIWPNAIEQGRIAGLNMAGKHTVYDGAEVVNVLDIFDTPVVTMGFTSKEIGKCNVISRFTPQSYKKLLLKNNKILGLQFIGTIRNTGSFYSLMKKGEDVSSIEKRLLDDNFVITPDVLPLQSS